MYFRVWGSIVCTIPQPQFLFIWLLLLVPPRHDCHPAPKHESQALQAAANLTSARRGHYRDTSRSYTKFLSLAPTINCQPETLSFLPVASYCLEQSGVTAPLKLNLSLNLRLGHPSNGATGLGFRRCRV